MRGGLPCNKGKAIGHSRALMTYKAEAKSGEKYDNSKDIKMGIWIGKRNFIVHSVSTADNNGHTVSSKSANY
jgi:hypothetical protein